MTRPTETPRTGENHFNVQFKNIATRTHRTKDSKTAKMAQFNA